MIEHNLDVIKTSDWLIHMGARRRGPGGRRDWGQGGVHPMASLQLEDRVSALEAEVADLRRRLEGNIAAGRPWWERIAGTFADDPAFEAAMVLGREYREAQQPGPVSAGEPDDISA